MKDKAFDIIRKNTMLIVLVLVVIFFSFTTHGTMLLPNTFNALITQNAYVYVLATGMLMCMLTGGNIDLSVGSFVCCVGVFGAQIMVEKGILLGVIAMIIAGIVYGCVLGFVISYLNIPPWIATLAGYLALRGWGVALLKGASSISLTSVPAFNNAFMGNMNDLLGGPVIGGRQYNLTAIVVAIIICVLIVIFTVRGRATKLKKGYQAESLTSMIVKLVLICLVVLLFGYKFSLAGGIPYAIIWVGAIILIYDFITSKTDIGRYFYTIGGNKEATRLSGIDTKLIMFVAYLNMAVLTVVSAFLTMARFQAANSTAGTNYEMDAISACVVGGVSAYGGSGKVFGMIVGATLIGVINLGMSLMSIDANWQKVVKGIVLLGAVVFEIMNNKKKNAK